MIKLSYHSCLHLTISRILLLIFHCLSGHLPSSSRLSSGKYRVAELLIELSDCSSTMISLRVYLNFEVDFQQVSGHFYHLSCHHPSLLPAQSPGQLPLSLFTIISIRSPVYTYSDAIFFFCILNILVLVQGYTLIVLDISPTTRP